MLRIVFSIVYYQQHLPVRLVSATTKSRWKFYAQVQRLSFHTAKTHCGSRTSCRTAAVASKEYPVSLKGRGTLRWRLVDFFQERPPGLPVDSLRRLPEMPVEWHSRSTATATG
jgi:hypothetical protein